MRPRDAWLATQGQLELQLNPATYDTWVRDCTFVSYQDNVFTLSVRNAYIKDWLEQRLYRSIRHTLSGVFRQPVDVVFVVSSPRQRFIMEEDEVLPLLSGVEAASPVPPPLMWTAEPQLEASDEWDPGLKSTYVFDTFVVGPSNQMAQAAAQAVTRTPGQTYNPLFIYGEVGLGKTHLMHAIGNACHYQGNKVLYTTSEQFTNHLVESIRNKNTAEFREHYRHVDILLVDDIQFITGKESTQEEFFHTFNALHGQGKQVVLASDRRPGEIKGLEKRLLSRLEWGLLVDIQPPSFETRLAIVREKAEMQGYFLPDDIALVLAKDTSGNIRELEGILTQVFAYTVLMGMPLTLEMAQRVIAEHRGGRKVRNRDQADRRRRLSLEQIIEGTARALQLALEDLVGKGRTKELSQARQWAIYLAREETQASWPEIGGALGGRNHSTVLYSYNKVAEQIAIDPQVRQKVDAIRRQIHDTIL